jgi:hypothetical protein
MPEMFYPVDRAISENGYQLDVCRLPVAVVQELNSQMNMNLHDEEQDFDTDDGLTDMMTVISDADLFAYLHPEGF